MISFNPILKTTTNIKDLLFNVAKSKKVKLSEIDFELMKVTTLIKTPKYEDWIILEGLAEEVLDAEVIQSKSFKIKQEYLLSVKPYKENPLFKDIYMNILTNKAKTKAVVVFKKGTVFPKIKQLSTFIRDEIYRQKLYMGFLIKNFEKGLISTIVKFSKAIKPDVALEKDVRFTVALSPGMMLPTDDKVILHYKHKEEDSRTLIDAVDVGDLIFEYVKPIFGKNGRTCDGKFIEVPQPKIKFGKYRADEKTIDVKEDDVSVKYYAKIEGYFKDEAGLVSVSQEIAMQSATFKNTGAIDTGQDKEILVLIAKDKDAGDSVGSGVVIDSKEVNVEGTVGANATLIATDLSVGEQTHRDATLEAVEHAKVKLHRGKLKAKIAEIEILENGTVYAEDIYVKKMLGGEIIGHRVVVDELVSNAIVIALENIEIGKISGDHNNLIIDPTKIEGYYDEIKKLEDKYKAQVISLEHLKANNTEKIKTHTEQIGRIKKFQQKINLIVKSGKVPKKADVIRVKQYKEDAVKLQSVSNEVTLKEVELKNLEAKLDELYEADTHAKIINNGIYDGHTKVVFVDIKTKESYEMSPEGEYKTIFLKQVGDKKKISF